MTDFSLRFHLFGTGTVVQKCREFDREPGTEIVPVEFPIRDHPCIAEDPESVVEIVASRSIFQNGTNLFVNRIEEYFAVCHSVKKRAPEIRNPSENIF